MCHSEPETVEHITPQCQVLAAEEYLNRHNHVAAQLHLDICRHYGIKMDAKTWNEHEPNHIMENDQATVLWDSQIITDIYIVTNLM